MEVKTHILKNRNPFKKRQHIIHSLILALTPYQKSLTLIELRPIA